MRKDVTVSDLAAPESGRSRRNFLQMAGGLAGVTLLAGSMAGCKKDKDDEIDLDPGVDLGSGDFGILNYAYALEQLEAAFYTRVIASGYSGMNADELLLLTDIRDHEIAHREFFKAALGANAIQDLEVDFSAIDFGSRSSVLNTAKTFEDLGVAAYNGAGQLIQDVNYLALAGKIVSVEARHAAYIRDLLSFGSFADLSAVDALGLDMAKDPITVLGAAQDFLKTKLNGSNLPTA